MIINLPTPDALNATALKLYFRAWHGIVDILLDFDNVYGSFFSAWFDSTDDMYADERAEYLEIAQENLHAFASIAQQANELALKARIVAVSPYLLLLNSDVSLSGIPAAIEFASLRTLDAVDLPKAVNALTPTPVSDAYLQLYTHMRVQRNQYTHLGDTTTVLNPIAMCAALADQYRELWPDRAWLSDRVKSTYVREGIFDGKHWSPRQSIMHLMEYDRDLIPAANFKKLFGVKKAEVKFGCFSCQNDWAVSRNGPGVMEVPTAFYDKSKRAMHCLICDADFNTILKTCTACHGKFAAPDAAEYGAGMCFTCGEESTA
jgi:hypothetical protein